MNREGSPRVRRGPMRRGRDEVGDGKESLESQQECTADRVTATVGIGRFRGAVRL